MDGGEKHCLTNHVSLLGINVIPQRYMSAIDNSNTTGQSHHHDNLPRFGRVLAYLIACCTARHSHYFEDYVRQLGPL